MKSKLLMSVALMASFLIISGTMFAHHGNSAYDGDHPITRVGTVTEFVWANPHCQIYFDSKDEKGNVVHWSVELNSPGILTRAGWHKDSVKAGDQVSVNLIPARNGSPVGFAGTKVKFADGRPLGTPPDAQ
jgi:hypothetical protein